VLHENWLGVLLSALLLIALLLGLHASLDYLQRAKWPWARPPVATERAKEHG
jgi:hypothetical protein